MNIFTLALKMQTASKSGGRFYPCARNKKRKQVWETVSPLRKKYKPQEHPVDVFTLASRNTRSGIAIKEIAEREPAIWLDRSFLLGERNESN